MDFYNEDITLSGTVTANNFVGSGSGLTGITANVWNGGTVTGATIFTNALTAATTTVSRLIVNAPSFAGIEQLQLWQISDADAYVRVENGTSTPSTFVPLLAFYQPTLSGVTAGAIQGRGIDEGTTPMLTLGSRTTANTALVNRPVLRISNFTTNIMEFLANGNVGLNTTSPTERLDVNGNGRIRGSIIFSDTAKSIDGGVGAVMNINAGINSMVFRGTSTSFMRGTQAGGVGIEITTGTTTINSSAILTLTSTEKGFLPPRMTTSQRDLIASPTAGLVIYNTDVNSLQQYNGSSWFSLGSSSFSGGTISGPTNFTGGLTANTISATTYYNLPISTDTFVTGATYSNNTFTYTNNTGGTFDVLFNTVTGLTVNGTMSANDVYVASATTGTSVANLAIQSDGKVIKAGGNAIVDNFYYSVSNSVDTTFFEDDKVILKWDETGNDLKFTMKVAPSGSGDMRSLGVLMGSTSTFNVAITTINVEYDLYSAGISAGNRMQAFVTAENDQTYPAYHITAYNTGESFHNTIWVQRITRI